MIPGGIVVKKPPANAEDARDADLTPWVGKIPLEKGMATHSSVLAWKIPWTEDPGGLQSMGSQSWTRLGRGTEDFGFLVFVCLFKHQILFLKWNFLTHRGDILELL